MIARAMTPPTTWRMCKPAITNKKEPAELLLGPVRAMLLASKALNPIICVTTNTRPKITVKVKPIGWTLNCQWCSGTLH